MSPIEYDIDQSHKEYKDLLNTLKKKGISREKIAEKLEVNKSTLTRIYNARRPNPQLCRDYIDLIKNVKEFVQYLGQVSSETEGQYDRMVLTIERKMNQLIDELQAIRESNERIERALNIGGKPPN